MPPKLQVMMDKSGPRLSLCMGPDFPEVIIFPGFRLWRAVSGECVFNGTVREKVRNRKFSWVVCLFVCLFVPRGR